MKDLTVLHVKVGQEPEVKTVKNTVDDLRALVGGSIEVVAVAPDILLVVNEEGYIEDLPINFVTAEINEYLELSLIQEINGNVFFVSVLGDDFYSLDKIQVAKVKNMFKHNRDFLVINAK